MSERSFVEPLLQSIYDAMIERGWKVQPVNMSVLANDGMRYPKKEDEGIIVFNRSGKKRWWLVLEASPVDGSPIVKAFNPSFTETFSASVSSHPCDLAQCLDELDKNINPVLTPLRLIPWLSWSRQ